MTNTNTAQATCNAQAPDVHSFLCARPANVQHVMHIAADGLKWFDPSFHSEQMLDTDLCGTPMGSVIPSPGSPTCVIPIKTMHARHHDGNGNHWVSFDRTVRANRLDKRLADLRAPRVKTDLPVNSVIEHKGTEYVVVKVEAEKYIVECADGRSATFNRNFPIEAKRVDAQWGARALKTWEALNVLSLTKGTLVRLADTPKLRQFEEFEWVGEIIRVNAKTYTVRFIDPATCYESEIRLSPEFVLPSL